MLYYSNLALICLVGSLFNAVLGGLKKKSVCVPSDVATPQARVHCPYKMK